MTTEQIPAVSTKGQVLHGAAGYDFLVSLVTLGRERSLREKMIKLARLQPGETVLDVGCGTGTLALAAKRHVGADGAVYGIDASPAMIAKAIKKAGKAGADVTFRHAAVQALPYPDSTFDVILSTLMLHHLPMKTRREGLSEMRRVLKPSGRILVVDFGSPQRKRGLFAQVHRHGHVDMSDVVDMLRNAGLAIVDGGAVGFSSLQFVLASATNREMPAHIQENERAHPSRRSFARIAIGLGAILVVLAHLGVLAALIGGLRALVQRIAQP